MQTTLTIPTPFISHQAPSPEDGPTGTICWGPTDAEDIDECHDDVIFFADEGGSWRVGIDWQKVLPSYFACLSATAEPQEYAVRVVEVADKHQRYNRKKHLAAARRCATPAQRKALQGA